MAEAALPAAPRRTRQGIALALGGGSLGGVVLFGLIGFVWWSLLQPSPGWVNIVIPEGTADLVKAGQPAPDIPDLINLEAAPGLRVVNNDVAIHRVGATLIPPGEIVRIGSDISSASDSFLCSFTPGGALGIVDGGRGGLLKTIIVPALLLGLPMGFFAGATTLVASRLKLDLD